MHIASVSNARVKGVVRLRAESAERRRRGAFYVEGVRDMRRALDGGFRVLELYEAEAAAGDRSLAERAAAGGARRFTVSGAVLEKLAYRRNARGPVAVVESRTLRADRLPAEGPVVVCAGLEKPGNVGAIVRSAAAAGASAVVLDRPDADAFNPNCVRASTGAVFALPIVCDTAEALIGGLRGRGYEIIALTPDAGRPYTGVDLSGRCAIVVGSEAEGLGEAWRGSADAEVSIRMRGGVDSLNASVAAAVVLFEAARQRRDGFAGAG